MLFFQFVDNFGSSIDGKEVLLEKLFELGLDEDEKDIGS